MSCMCIMFQPSVHAARKDPKKFDAGKMCMSVFQTYDE